MQAAKFRDCCCGSSPLLPHICLYHGLSSAPYTPASTVAFRKAARHRDTGILEVRDTEMGQAVGKDGVSCCVWEKFITWVNTPGVLLQIPLPLWGTTFVGVLLRFYTRVVTVQYSANMVQIGSTVFQVGHWNTKGLWEGCGKYIFFFYSEPHVTAALFRSGFVAQGLWVPHAKSPFFEHRRRTLQDQIDLAPVFLGHSFARKTCIRDFFAIRSFDIWSLLCSIRHRKIFTFNAQVLFSIPWQQTSLIICVLTGLQRDLMWPHGKGRKLIIRWQKNALIVSASTYK